MNNTTTQCTQDSENNFLDMIRKMESIDIDSTNSESTKYNLIKYNPNKKICRKRKCSVVDMKTNNIFRDHMTYTNITNIPDKIWDYSSKPPNKNDLDEYIDIGFFGIPLAATPDRLYTFRDIQDIINVREKIIESRIKIAIKKYILR